MLETKTLVRVGGTAPVAVDVRFLAATHRRLADILAALRAAGGNQSSAARALGLPRTTFLNKLRRHGLGG